MTYAQEVARQAKQVSVFAKVGRKRRFDGGDLILDSGKYYLDFALGDVASIAIASQATSETLGRTVLSENTSSIGSLTTNQYFVDTTRSRIYFGPFADVADNTFADDTSATIVIEYFIYLASADIGWFKDPVDSATDRTFWSGAIFGSPQIRRSVADNFAGFAPVEISPLRIAWQNSDLFSNAYSDSYVDCQCHIWLSFGAPIEPSRIQKIFTGKIKGIQMSDTDMSLNLIEDSAFLDRRYNGRFYQDESTALNPSDTARAIPLIYGKPKWIRCTNIDYINKTPTTSDNRNWAVHDLEFGTANDVVTLVTVGSPSGGDYPITLSAADKALMIDSQLVLRQSDQKWARLTQSGGVLFLTPIDSHTPAPGDLYARPSVQEVYFQVPSKQDAVVNWAANQSSATMSSQFVGGVLVLQLTSGFEAAATALGISAIDPDDFEVWVKCIGPGMGQQLNGSYLEGDGPTEVGALAWYLINVAGFTEAQLDTQSFIDAVAARPFQTNDGNEATFITPIYDTAFETHRDVIARLLRNIGAVGYFNSDGQFAIKCRDSLGTADWTLTDAEIDKASLQYELRQDDIRAFQLNGSSAYVGMKFTTLTAKPATTSNKIRFADGPVGGVISTAFGFSLSEQAIEAVDLYDFMKEQQAGGRYVGRLGLDRLAKYYANRQGLLTLKAYGEIVEAVPGETVSISREILPGFAYTPGTLRTRSFFILEVRREADSVELVLEDQYSIEEAGGF